MMPAKIMCNFIYPPIPYRGMDWCAYVDGTEEQDKYGYGETAQEAIADLKDRIDDDDPELWAGYEQWRDETYGVEP